MARILKKRSDLHIVPTNYEHAVSLIEKFTACSVRNRMYAADTETGGLSWYKDPLYMISLYTSGMKTIVIPLAWEDSPVSVGDLKELLQPLVSLKEVTCLMFNSKFDMHFLLNQGVIFKNQMVDVRVAGFMINNSLPANLKGRAKLELGVESIEFNKLFDLKRGKTLLDYPVSEVAPYAANDAIWTYKLGKKFMATGFSEDKNSSFSIGEDPELTQLYRKVEHKIMPILFKMERTGVMVSKERIEAYRARVIPIMKGLEKKAIAIAGTPFNLRSVKQLNMILRKRGLDLESTDVEHLQSAYRETKDPLIEALLKHRKLAKTLGTYADGLLKVMDSNGAVHTSYDPVGTISGRLASSDPNLQNIERDDEIRRFFRPRPNCLFIVRDFGQIELRVAAHVARDPAMIEEFKQGLDIHSLGAATIFNKDIKDVTPDERQASKATTSFGVLFDMAAFSLAMKLGVSEEKAELFIYNWFKKYHGIDKFFKRLQASAVQVGHVRSFLGRLRQEPNLRNPERRKVAAALRSVRNTVIQGPAADLVKLAMIKIDEDEELRSWGYTMLLQIHDEILGEVPFMNAYKANRRIEYHMANFPVAKKLEVPLITDGGIGEDWPSAKKGKLNKEFALKYGWRK